MNVLYVPSLVANFLFVYQMTHTGPPKQVVFGLDSVEITDISTGKTIVKGVVNHASKAYELSYFRPCSDLVQSQIPFERGGKTILSTPFTYDNVSIGVSNLESKAEDPIESIYEIEDEVHSDPDLNPVPTPNPRPKCSALSTMHYAEH